MTDEDRRHVGRMLNCLMALESQRMTLVAAADSLFFLLQALSHVPEAWGDEFARLVANLESAGTASVDQRLSMGDGFDDLIVTTVRDLRRLLDVLMPRGEGSV